MVSVVALTIALFCLLLSAKYKWDFFSPINIYVFSQSITLGIAYLKLDDNMSYFKLITWLVILGSGISFILGSLAVSMTIPKISKVSSPSKYFNKDRFAIIQKRYYWGLHILFSFIAFGLFLVGVAKVIISVGTIPIFSPNLDEIFTKDFDIGLFAFPLASGPLCAVLFAISSFKQLNPHKHLRIISMVMVALSILIGISTFTSRGALFFSIGLIIISYNYINKRISVLKISMGLIVAIGLFLAIAGIKSQFVYMKGNGLSDKMMKLPYVYIANNYWNLDYALNSPNDIEYHPYTYGMELLSGPLDILQFSHLFRKAYRWDSMFNKRIQKTKGFNSVGYQWEVFKDLHFPGIILFPFLFAIIYTWLYYRVRIKLSIRNILIYSLMSNIVLMWFFDEYYKNPIYWIWSIYIIITCSLCFKEDPKIS